MADMVLAPLGSSANNPHRHSGMRLRSAIADLRRRPGIHTPDGGYGFRARSLSDKIDAVNFALSSRPGMTAFVFSARERAAVLFLGRRDHFKILVRAGHRRARSKNVPLVLDLVGGQRGHRIHFVHQLMIRAAEITLPG